MLNRISIILCGSCVDRSAPSSRDVTSRPCEPLVKGRLKFSQRKVRRKVLNASWGSESGDRILAVYSRARDNPAWFKIVRNSLKECKSFCILATTVIADEVYPSAKGSVFSTLYNMAGVYSLNLRFPRDDICGRVGIESMIKNHIAFKEVIAHF